MVLDFRRDLEDVPECCARGVQSEEIIPRDYWEHGDPDMVEKARVEGRRRLG